MCQRPPGDDYIGCFEGNELQILRGIKARAKDGGMVFVLSNQGVGGTILLSNPTLGLWRT